MVHGDDSGLVLPPRVAPYQVVIVPIGRDNWRETVLPRAKEIQDTLVAAGFRVTLDEREELPGWKFSEWEMRGVPLRIEIGPKDIEKSQVLTARRDTREKAGVPMDGLAARVREILDDIQRNLLERALRFREEHTQRVDSYGRSSWCWRAARVRDRALVRFRRLRGPDQDRHAGDDPQHADERRRAVRPLHPLRQPGAGGRVVCQGALRRLLPAAPVVRGIRS
jgi:hypothetical protein